MSFKPYNIINLEIPMVRAVSLSFFMVVGMLLYSFVVWT